MNKKTNLKAVPDEKPDKLTWHQINRVANAVAFELMMCEVDTAPLMVLLREISLNPFDHSYVETIVNLLNHHLFGCTSEFDRACNELIAGERRRVVEKGGAR